ncbi:thyroglobulin-like [Gigantopelta aegis]|uniref:thyroglobulin-like n=1 Tax=Gigantopelta aegis TaxID=1735272 RepID=UPI001B88A6BC|nr:thyroglobulin-like [Gigantopelta aegis]
MHFPLLICLLPLLTFAEKACDEAHQEYQTAMEDTSTPLLGLEEPRCDENGQYADRICRGTDCWCVRPNGEEIPRYHHRRYEVNQKAMTCECARQAAAYKATGLIGLTFRCTELGAFEPVQCTGSVCYCVDSNGQRDSSASALPIWEKHILQCS